MAGNINGGNGGGGTTLYGAMIVGGAVTLGFNSPATLYLNSSAAKQIHFSASSAGNDGYVQTAWKEAMQSWPQGLP